MTYPRFKMINFDNILYYLATQVNSRAPYDYLIVGNYDPAAQSSYDNLVTWNDAAPKPTWAILMTYAQASYDWFAINAGAVDVGQWFVNIDSAVNGITNGSAAQYLRGNGSFATFPTIPSTTRSTSSLTLNTSGTGATGTQISETKDSTIRVTYSTQVTYSLSGSPASVVTLKYCSTNSANEGDWIAVGSTATRQPTGLTVTIGQVVGAEGQITADVPAGWYVKALPSGAGTHTEAFVSGQKTIHG